MKGANGVILVTTKRGQEGKAKIDVGFNATLKAPSKLPNKYDSYDALMLRNQVIEDILIYCVNKFSAHAGGGSGDNGDLFHN